MNMLIAESLDVVMAGIAANYRYDANNLELVRNKAASLFDSLGSDGVVHLHEATKAQVRQWILAPVRTPNGKTRPPAANYARARRGVALAVLKEAAKLGARLDPHELVGEPIPSPDTSEAPARLLTDDQLQRVCERAASGTARSREPLLVALMLSGASLADAAAATAGDIDLAARTIRFADGRVCALGEWPAAVIGRYLAANPIAPDERLCTGADTSHDNAVRSVTRRTGRIMREAGLESRAGLSPRSIRLTAARRVLDLKGIIAATRFLGSPSLDSTARVLGHDWQHVPSAAEEHASGDAPTLPDDDAAGLCGLCASEDAVGGQR